MGLFVKHVDKLVVAQEVGQRARQVFTDIFDSLTDAIDAADEVLAQESAVIDRAQQRRDAAVAEIKRNEALSEKLNALLNEA